MSWRAHPKKLTLNNVQDSCKRKSSLAIVVSMQKYVYDTLYGITVLMIGK